ncbi:MAG: hypothetical protein NT139_01130 [Candidatus Woesearchaeota archaeon]|nr:hypothetical protein [Candidatus Woesearchaeota archaeon]
MSVARLTNYEGVIVAPINTPLDQYPLLNAELINLQDQIDSLAPGGGFLQIANNLNDVASVSASRANLGLGSASLLNSNQILQSANNLNDVASVSASRANLGLGSAALLNSNQILQSANNLNDVASVSASRVNLGLGSAAVQNDTFFLQAANNLSDLTNLVDAQDTLGITTINNYLLSNALLKSANNLSDVFNTTTSRANLGCDNASNINSGTLGGAYLPASTVNPLALVGVSNGSAAASGVVGEFLSTVMNRSDRIVVVPGDQIISTLNLSAGDWDVSGIAYFEADGSNTIISQITGGLNTSAFGAPDLAQRTIYNNPSLYNICSFPLSTIRVSSSSPVTVYAWSLVTQNAGVVRASMSIYARRVR